MTAVIRRSLIQGICGVAVVAGLSVSSAIERPVELRMVGIQTDRVEQTASWIPKGSGDILRQPHDAAMPRVTRLNTST